MVYDIATFEADLAQLTALGFPPGQAEEIAHARDELTMLLDYGLNHYYVDAGVTVYCIAPDDLPC